MSLQRLQSFIGYLRTNKLMEQGQIIAAVKCMQQLDRRIGQLAMLRGFLTPEQVSKVMLAQTQINKKFIELATEMEYLNGARGEELVKVQKDDLFAFSQSVVSAGIKTLPEMVGHLKAFLTSAPPEAEADEKKDAKPAGGLVADIRTNLKKIKGIAPLPGVVTQVIQMLDDPKVSMEKVGKVITMDPGLVTTLLRIVNSAFYGLRSQAKNITQGLVILGTKKIKELVLVAGIMQKFNDLPPEEAKRFWDKSITAAQWSKELAAFLKFPDIDLMFINGFIHNIGELVIFQHFPAEHEHIRQLKESGTGAVTAERQTLGGSHADISAFLFEIWEFPAPVIQAAMVHHQPLDQIQEMKSIKREALIVHMAAALIEPDPDKDPFEYIVEIGAIAEKYRKLLQLEQLVFEDMAVGVQTKVGELKKMFNFG